MLHPQLRFLLCWWTSFRRGRIRVVPASQHAAGEIMPHWLPHRPLPIYHYLIQFQLVHVGSWFWTVLWRDKCSTRVLVFHSNSAPASTFSRQDHRQIDERLHLPAPTNRCTMRSQSPGQSEAGFLLWPPCLVDRDWRANPQQLPQPQVRQNQKHPHQIWSNLINTSISGAATPKTTSLATSLSDRGPRARGSGGAWSMRDRDTLALTSRLAVDCRKIILHCSHMSTDVNKRQQLHSTLTRPLKFSLFFSQRFSVVRMLWVSFFSLSTMLLFFVWLFVPQQQNALGSSAIVKVSEQTGAAPKPIPPRFPGSK